jgi:hypothetical protein
MSIDSQRKVASSVSSRLSGISAVLFVAVLFVAATQVCAGQTTIGSKRNHGFDIILLDSEVREAAFARVRIPRPHASWEFPSDFYDLSETGGTFAQKTSGFRAIRIPDSP